MISSKQIVHREADGRRIRGTWRQTFIRNCGTYFLTELYIWADGMVDAWGLLTLDEFERKLASGWVATSLPEGGQASAHHLAAWRFEEPETWYTPELLLAEVRDTIDELNGRPDSTGRCRALLDVFLADRTEANRLAVRDAYHAIPETLRRYALGDMDCKDQPLRVLVAGVGGTDEETGEVITREIYQEDAIDYFEQLERWGPAPAGSAPPAPAFTSVEIPHTYARGSDDPGKEALRTTYPAPFTFEGITYPTVEHAFQALSTADPAARAAITAADTPGRARALAAGAPPVPDAERTRTALMARLLAAQFAQHPALASVLRATGDATIVYHKYDSAPDDDFWGDNGGRGRNWLGRLLELTRAGLPPA
ncbi:NADAR family protein [Streptomyces sp. NPDC058953]|uniref:NADAR family protein n=1 Tax=unclassified Streptomyces TaxID=2593676 RepID=UPI0036B7BBF0